MEGGKVHLRNCWKWFSHFTMYSFYNTCILILLYTHFAMLSLGNVLILPYTYFLWLTLQCAHYNVLIRDALILQCIHSRCTHFAIYSFMLYSFYNVSFNNVLVLDVLTLQCIHFTMYSFYNVFILQCIHSRGTHYFTMYSFAMQMHLFYNVPIRYALILQCTHSLGTYFTMYSFAMHSFYNVLFLRCTHLQCTFLQCTCFDVFDLFSMTHFEMRLFCNALIWQFAHFAVCSFWGILFCDILILHCAFLTLLYKVIKCFIYILQLQVGD